MPLFKKMLYKLVVSFLCEAELVDEVPIKSLLELINHDGTFLYHLMKRLGVDVSSIHNRLYHRSHTRANILSNHEVMLAFIATSGISPTLLPAPKVLYSATKEGVAANLIYQVLRCIYRKRIRQAEGYIIKMANYLNALYTLRSEPVYQLTGFSRHTSLPASLVKLSLSTSCISFSIFVAGIHRFLSESGVPCVDFLTNFYKFPTTLQHMTRNHTKMQHLLAALGVPLFFSPLAWLSIKDEEPYFDLRLIQVYLIFDKFRGCVSTLLFKKLKQILFASRSMDPALPQSLDLMWRDAICGSCIDPQDGLLAFAKSTDPGLDFDTLSNDSDICHDEPKRLDPNSAEARSKKDSASIMLCPTDIQTVAGGEYDDTLPKLLPHEAEHLMMVLSELPEPSRSVTSQGPGSPTHYRETKTHRIRNADPISATHPIYSDEEHDKLLEARSYKSSATVYTHEVVEPKQEVIDRTELADYAPLNDTELRACQSSQPILPASADEQLEYRVQKLLSNDVDLTSDPSESQKLPALAQVEDKESSEDSQMAQARHSSQHKSSSSPPGALHIQVHRIHDDTMRHKSSLPHPCSMSPSAHRLSDECIQRSFHNHHEVITDSEDEVCSTITPDQIKAKYRICFLPSSVVNVEHTSEHVLPPDETSNPTVNIQKDESGPKQELCIKYSESEDDDPSLMLPPPLPGPSVSHAAKQISSSPNLPQLGNSRLNEPDDRSSTSTQEYDLSGIVLKNPSPRPEAHNSVTQNGGTNSPHPDTLQLSANTAEQNQARIEHLTHSQDTLSNEDFRLARVGLLPQSGSGKINSSQLQSVNLSTLAATDKQLADELLVEHGVVSSFCAENTAPVLSAQDLDEEAKEAQERYVARFPIRIQKHIRENHLLALSELPSRLLGDRATFPADLTRVFINANGHIYRLYGLDFIHISVDGSVHIEPDEDLESDQRALKASLSSSNAADLPLNYISQPSQVGTHVQSQQSSILSNTLASSEKTTLRDFPDPQYFANHKKLDSLNYETSSADLPAVQTLCLTLPAPNTPGSACSDSSCATSKHLPAMQEELCDESVPVSKATVEPCLIEDLGPLLNDCTEQQDIHLLSSSSVAPLVCLDDLDDAGEAFVDAECVGQSLESDHVLVHDIYLPNTLDGCETYSTVDGPSSVFSAQSMRKSIGISSASSKRSLNPMLSMSSHVSRPTSSQIDCEAPRASDTTELAIAITEVLNDPIIAHIESPTTDRLITAHGPRQNSEQNPGVTPDPSAVCALDEQSRPSTSSVALTFVTETQTVPPFDITPQIQLENLLTSKFMDCFIESYLKKTQFRVPSTDKCIAVGADADANVLMSTEGETPVTATLRPTASLKQKLNHYVHSVTNKTRMKGETITTPGQGAHQTKSQLTPTRGGAQTHVVNGQHTIRATHLSAPTSAKHTSSSGAGTHGAEQSLPPAFRNLNKEQACLYHQINDGAHLNDSSPQLCRKLRSNKLAFSVPVHSPIQRFMYTLKCLNIDSSRISSETTLFSVLRNNNSGFYLGIYARQYIVLRIEISDVYKIERNLCQVYLYFLRAFVATGDNLLFAHLDLLDDRTAQSFVRDLTAAVEMVKPLISER